MTQAILVDALRETVAWEPAAERVGNLTIGRGTVDGRIVHVALIENFVASGSLGQTECDHLAAVFDLAARDRTPVVMAIDSAGARVSEGLRALGAFRRLYRAGLGAALAGAPIAAVLGRNCYGGASMLAHLARERLFSPNTQLAMSGPAVIAAASGLDASDEAFRAMASAAFSPASRAKATGANRAWAPGDDVLAWLRGALRPRDDAGAAFHERHAAMRARLGEAAAPIAQEVYRDELKKLYDSHEACLSDGVLEGQGERHGAGESFVGLVDNKPVDASRAWRFAEAVWRHAQKPPARLEVFLDSASHAARLDEERRVLSEFIVDMAAALAALAAKGTRVGLTITGRAGGGVYVALAAPAQRVASVYARARIEVLPGVAVAAILGTSRDEAPAFGEYRAAGVADEEFKLGFLPANP
jgi:acetyl-CoA carboxylase beta subunit